MSGGVDSSVCALLLMEHYEVQGATMKLFETETILSDSKTCCSITDVEDARRVCHRLGLEHHVFHSTDLFYEQVIARFRDAYTAGLTPNPCIDCNRYVKFPHLLRRAEQLGLDYIASGHYAQVKQDETTGRYALLRSVDREKDQSYVLYAMTQEELSKTLLPLGDKSKTEIRQIANAHGLVTANKPDSQDICFVPDGNYVSFLKEKMGVQTQRGEILDEAGQVLGQHQGAIAYTIGQRRGLGVGGTKEPFYVIKKDMVQNTVTLGPQDALFTQSFSVAQANWISFDRLEKPVEVSVMTRYRDKEVLGTIRPGENGLVEVSLAQPKRAVTPGQAAVFYQGEAVVGGGVIV